MQNKKRMAQENDNLLSINFYLIYFYDNILKLTTVYRAIKLCF